ncbi:MAG TPA: tRNA (adenosine(37)-N6)-threonylcarbamoyltransferase complex ATPase subunit type 1 TsaE [Candidatus Paceibacterota bacterium]|nr:tRNA (adenosine(37)-N6)-threonylcarbamoyltransferase complex ATPase subunit type 1 TsaE [Candidatus Paceibacterota bacterium]
MEISVATPEGLAEAAASFLTELVPSTTGATLITLSGDLGAGKTAFTKALANELGVTDSVTSPTFVLEKVYLLPGYGTWKRLIHIDAYRLKSGEELAALGFDEAMHDPQTLIVLEWPEQVSDALPKPTAALRITASPDGTRTLSYD